MKRRSGKKAPAGSRQVAVGLVRCSTDRQDRSVAEQEAAIRAWAKQHGTRVLRVFADEGVSGLELSRPGLDACLNFLATSPEKGTVVLWSRDRLVRPEDPIDGLVMERQIRYAGWELCYLTGSNTTGHPLVDAILGLVEHHAAGEYLRKLARDSLRNLLSRLKAGDVPGGKIPYGYAKAVLDEEGSVVRVIPRTKKHRKTSAELTRLVPGDREEVKAVRWIFEEFLRGWSSPHDVAEELNRRRAPTPTALPWNKATVREILRNPVYMGDIVWNRETSARCVRLLGGALSAKLAMHKSRRSGRRIAWARNDPKDHVVLRDRHSPIVSREVFARVQAVAAERGRPSEESVAATRRSFALGGLLFCGKCGKGMFSRTVHVRGRVYRYYYCSATSHDCRVRADHVERGVLCELRRRLRSAAASRTRGSALRLKDPSSLLLDLEAALEEEDRVRAKSAFRVLLDRVSVHAPRGRHPAKHQPRTRAWRVRVTPARQSTNAIGGKTSEILIDMGRTDVK